MHACADLASEFSFQDCCISGGFLLGLLLGELDSLEYHL